MTSGLILIPIGWHFLKDYQKERLITFLNPENDPLGAGYHIIQSMIAIGSGEIFGKGFLSGSQTQLKFLPEQQTDFVFSVFAEEWGFIGGLILIIHVYGYYLLGIKNCLASQRFIRHNYSVRSNGSYFVGSFYQYRNGFGNFAGCRHSASFFQLRRISNAFFDGGNRVINECKRAQIYFAALVIDNII